MLGCYRVRVPILCCGWHTACPGVPSPVSAAVRLGFSPAWRPCLLHGCCPDNCWWFRNTYVCFLVAQLWYHNIGCHRQDKRGCTSLAQRRRCPSAPRQTWLLSEEATLQSSDLFCLKVQRSSYSFLPSVTRRVLVRSLALHWLSKTLTDHQFNRTWHQKLTIAKLGFH